MLQTIVAYVVNLVNNYLLIAAKIFESAGRKTMARPGPARQAGTAGRAWRPSGPACAHL